MVNTLGRHSRFGVWSPVMSRWKTILFRTSVGIYIFINLSQVLWQALRTKSWDRLSYVLYRSYHNHMLTGTGWKAYFQDNLVYTIGWSKDSVSSYVRPWSQFVTIFLQLNLLSENMFSLRFKFLYKNGPRYWKNLW